MQSDDPVYYNLQTENFETLSIYCFDQTVSKIWNLYVPFQLNQPLDPEDDRRYCYIKAMTSAQTPVFYRNAVIDRLINVCMLRGMKG